MAGDANEDRMLSAAKTLIAAGVAIHWLKKRSKAPLSKEWTDAPVHTAASAERSYRPGYNLGIRTGKPSKTPWGYLHLIDMDIRDADQVGDAWDLLQSFWPAAQDAPYVISGSGGESKHVYFFTDKPFYKLTLGKSAGFTKVWSEEKQREVKKYDWEVVLYGTNVQAVLPPSIHPDTGREYVWGRPIDFDLLDMGVGPLLDSDMVAEWGAADDDLNLDDDDDLTSLMRQRPMDLSEEEIDQVVADLPEEWVDDRDQWYQVGMALHHQYEGRARGFERWTEWSRGSEKYDARDQARVWKSFKGDKRPLRMATLIKAAGEARDQRIRKEVWDEFEDADLDLDDMLSGPVPQQALVPYEEKNDDLDDLLSGEPSPVKPAASPRFDDDKIDPDWETYFDRSEDGTAIKPTLHNIELIIRHDKRTRGIVAYNEFTQEVVLVKEPLRRKENRRGARKPIRQLDGSIWTPDDTLNGMLWSDSHDNGLRIMIEAPKTQGGYQIKTSDRDLRSAVDVVAQKRRFHPVRTYLDSLQWDGRPRVERLFIDYMGSPDTPYHREAAMLFMIGAVTRVYEPGHKFDFVPILKGLQGKRKSTFVNILARNWFGELDGDVHDRKGMVEAMQGCWIMELPELSAFSRAEINMYKAFVSKRTDKVRMAYAKRAALFHRQCVFIGTTNDEEPLRDPTGNRRFWIIVCDIDEIDTDRLQREVDQLWAEATAMYREWRHRNSGALPLFLRNADAQVEARRLQEEYRQERSEDILVGQIEDWLNQAIGSDLGFDDADDEEPRFHNEICGVQIWVEMMGRDRYAFSERDQQLIARALQKLPGWLKDGNRRVPKWGRQRMYRRAVPL